MQIEVRMIETEIREAIAEYIHRAYGVKVNAVQLTLWVKSKQNYKSEWEQAHIKLEAHVTEILE